MPNPSRGRLKSIIAGFAEADDEIEKIGK